MRKTLRYIIFGLNVIAVLSLLIAYVSVYYPPDKWWIPSLFGLIYHFLLIVNFFFILFWVFMKPKFIFLSLVVVISGWGFIARYFQIKGKEIEKGEVKILSYNVQHFSGQGNAVQKENADKIVSFLAEQEADIICLQEVRLRTNNIFNLQYTVGELANINHYQYARSSTTYGSVTMTRFPILAMEEIRFENSQNITIYTDVLIKEDTVRIFNVHLQSYHIDPTSYSVIESPGISREEDIREMREISMKFKSAVKLRAEQVKQIRRYIEESPYHVIVCGDFNDTPASYSYQKMKGDLTDAFVSSGKGIGRTYAGKLPSFRIDYILYSKGFDSFNFKTIDFEMSDHLPISCELVKNQ